MVKKIPSGILGLNPLIDGGINENSAVVVVGSSGAGKTICATQFLRKGLEMGQEGIYITLDEPPSQIISEATELGWDNIGRYVDEDLLVFIDASGKQFSDFIRKELADFVRDWKGANARIAIDPLTPVLWSSKEKYEQRELVSFLLRETKRIGTVLCTLEEHGAAGDLSTPETVIPLYLADTVIHLKYMVREGVTSRTLKIIKCRRSRHSQFPHPYTILRGPGVVVMESEGVRPDAGRLAIIEELYRRRVPQIKAAHPSADPGLLDRIAGVVSHIAKEGDSTADPEEVLDLVLTEYGVGKAERGKR